MPSTQVSNVGVAAAVIAILAVSACSGSATDSSTSSDGTHLGATVSSAKPGSIGDKWVKWDKDACSLVPAPSAATWTAVLRKAPNLRIGLGEQTEGEPTADAMSGGVKTAAKKIGASLIVANYLYPDASKAIEGARSIATRKADAVISWNVVASAMDGVMAAYNKACIPVVQITSAAPNAVVFGADSTAVGESAGTYLAKWAKEKGWKADGVTVVGLTTPSLGEIINLRPNGCVEAIKRDLPGVKSSTLELPASTTADAQAKMTDWLTANPNAKQVLTCVISDTNALGVANAAKGANRVGEVAVVGVGGSPDVIKALNSGSSGSYIGTVDFGWAHYADFVVPMALDLLAGKAVPASVSTPLNIVEAK